MKKKIKEFLEIEELDKVAGGLKFAPNARNISEINRLTAEYDNRKFINIGENKKIPRFTPSILLSNNSF